MDETEDAAFAHLEDVAARLRLLGVRPYRTDDGSLWIGRVCLRGDGIASLDGRSHQDAREIGLALEGLAAALRRAAMVEGQERPAPCRPGPRRLRGRQADEATARFLALAERANVAVQRLGPGRWVVAGRVLYQPPNGRIRVLPDGRTLDRRGLETLGDVLRQELSDAHPEAG